ncbi:MAG: phospholipid-binding protein MlaC [Kiloniellaceae bacterium]
MPVVVTVTAQLPRGVRFVLLAIVLAASLGAPPARAGTDAGAGAFLIDLSQRAIAHLTAPGISEEEKERRFRVLMNEGFDIEAIGRFVLGRYWRGASQTERKAFLAAFEDMIVYRFLPLFADYSGETLKIGAVRQFGENPNLFSVSSELRRRQGEPIEVAWRIRKTENGYKILDIVAQGVSIAVTLRSEYASVLKRNGGKVSALTQALRDKIATL